MRLHSRITGAVSVAALSLGTLVATGAPAAAAPDVKPGAPAAVSSAAAFDSVTISGWKKTAKLPKSTKTRRINFTVHIAGSPSSNDIRYRNYDANGNYPRVVPVKSKVKDPTKPRILYPTIDAGANTYTLEIPSYVSPGRYDVHIPVTQVDWTTSPQTITTKNVTARINISATKKISKQSTRISANTWRTGKAAKFSISAPAYQKGAKVSMLYKKKGTKKFVKLQSKKLKLKKGAYSSTVKFSTKALTKNGKLRFKFKKVKWAPGYAITGKVKVGRR